jgi:hypothetical protein
MLTVNLQDLSHLVMLSDMVALDDQPIAGCGFHVHLLLLSRASL